MRHYILRRLLYFLPTLLAIYAIAFFLMHAAPGSPFVQEKSLPPEVLEARRAEFYLDRPLLEQFARYGWDLLTLRGHSSIQYPNRNVIRDILVPAFPVSLSLGVLALAVAVVVGTAAGVVSAARPRSLADHLAMAGAMIGVSQPSFVIASLLVAVFAFTLRWLPVGGWGTPSQMVLPALALAALPAATIARLVRTGMLDVLSADFIRTARAKGLRECSVLFDHALPSAWLPVLGYLGPAAASIFTGSFVVEKIFASPGVGTHFVDSALHRDHPLILATVLLYAVLLVVFNLAVDIGYAWLDPRIRYD
ncbi:MAG TPA: ABC transporter permease subunit [Phycisphaerae bacterium]|nr:ABC transporter permease subunit [Phycisphaerae bacterium]